MHHQYDVARREPRQAIAHADDLVRKTFAARWLAVRRRPPEITICGAELAGEIVMTASRPVAEILLAEVWLCCRPQPQRSRRLASPQTGTGELRSLSWQFRTQCRERHAIAGVGWSIVIVDHAPWSRNRRVPDQPQM